MEDVRAQQLKQALVSDNFRHRVISNLWMSLTMLDTAPDLDVAFENDEDREAAHGLHGSPGGIGGRWCRLIAAGSWHLQIRT